MRSAGGRGRTRGPDRGDRARPVWGRRSCRRAALGHVAVPKATGVSTRTMEIFRTWGIEDEIRAGAIAVDPVVTVGETLVGPSLVTVPFGYPTDGLRRSRSARPPPAAVRRIIWSPYWQDTYGRMVGGSGLGEQVTGLVQDADEVLVTTIEAAGPAAPGDRCRRPAQLRPEPPSASRWTSWEGWAIFMAVTFRADLTRPVGRVAPRARIRWRSRAQKGFFVPTGAGDRWVMRRGLPRRATGGGLVDHPMIRLTAPRPGCPNRSRRLCR